MQNNPDVNSLNIGEQPESHPESVNTGEGSERTSVEGMKKPVAENEQTGESAEKDDSTEKKKLQKQSFKTRTADLRS